MFAYLDRPLTYVYNTLHYYDRRLQDRASLKRKLVSVIVGKNLFGTSFLLLMVFVQSVREFFFFFVSSFLVTRIIQKVMGV